MSYLRKAVSYFCFCSVFSFSVYATPIYEPALTEDYKFEVSVKNNGFSEAKQLMVLDIKEMEGVVNDMSLKRLELINLILDRNLDEASFVITDLVYLSKQYDQIRLSFIDDKENEQVFSSMHVFRLEVEKTLKKLEFFKVGSLMIKTNRSSLEIIIAEINQTYKEHIESQRVIISKALNTVQFIN